MARFLPAPPRAGLLLLALTLGLGIAAPVEATFSIVARDPTTATLGVAVQSKYFGVGTVVPHARAGVGALATQAQGSLEHGRRGLALLAEGVGPTETLRRLLADDPLRNARQLGIITLQGAPLTHSGDQTLPWSGGRSGAHYAVQGNLLAGPEVVAAMAAAFESTPGALSSRLVAALAAGQAAGGDQRGRQSAALLVVRAGAGYQGESDRLIDLRVDDHPAPIRELARLLDIRLAQLALERCQALLAGDEAITAGDLARARTEALRATRLDPRNDTAWLTLAMIETARGAPTAAAAAGRHALLLNPLLKRHLVADGGEPGLPPAVLERLLENPGFRGLWNALPTPEDVAR
ncbi:DUF1028 domain-containing protein [Marichromatium bheemlicum]|uniref:DUF1028 domain-containing protein n=1 Tax=Marichromatium bheemlicum TaxID=365339 RepID=A0ABX1I3D8_9GAMM|nr:DUF1028 domain-containing protein [Marichromatium bheemlicum]NKN31989.1 DUF1028 domain-containing protein [Marichromatium bheemlicum]